MFHSLPDVLKIFQIQFDRSLVNIAFSADSLPFEPTYQFLISTLESRGKSSLFATQLCSQNEALFDHNWQLLKEDWSGLKLNQRLMSTVHQIKDKENVTELNFRNWCWNNWRIFCRFFIFEKGQFLYRKVSNHHKFEKKVLFLSAKNCERRKHSIAACLAAQTAEGGFSAST